MDIEEELANSRPISTIRHPPSLISNIEIIDQIRRDQQSSPEQVALGKLYLFIEVVSFDKNGLLFRGGSNIKTEEMIIFHEYTHRCLLRQKDEDQGINIKVNHSLAIDSINKNWDFIFTQHARNIKAYLDEQEIGYPRTEVDSTTARYKVVNKYKNGRSIDPQEYHFVTSFRYAPRRLCNKPECRLFDGGNVVEIYQNNSTVCIGYRCTECGELYETDDTEEFSDQANRIFDEQREKEVEQQRRFRLENSSRESYNDASRLMGRIAAAAASSSSNDGEVNKEKIQKQCKELVGRVVQGCLTDLARSWGPAPPAAATASSIHEEIDYSTCVAFTQTVDSACWLFMKYMEKYFAAEYGIDPLINNVNRGSVKVAYCKIMVYCGIYFLCKRYASVMVIDFAYKEYSFYPAKSGSCITVKLPSVKGLLRSYKTFLLRVGYGVWGFADDVFKWVSKFMEYFGYKEGVEETHEHYHRVLYVWRLVDSMIREFPSSSSSTGSSKNSIINFHPKVVAAAIIFKAVADGVSCYLPQRNPFPERLFNSLQEFKRKGMRWELPKHIQDDLIRRRKIVQDRWFAERLPFLSNEQIKEQYNRSKQEIGKSRVTELDRHLYYKKEQEKKMQADMDDACIKVKKEDVSAVDDYDWSIVDNGDLAEKEEKKVKPGLLPTEKLMTEAEKNLRLKLNKISRIWIVDAAALKYDEIAQQQKVNRKTEVAKRILRQLTNFLETKNQSLIIPTKEWFDIIEIADINADRITNVMKYLPAFSRHNLKIPPFVPKKLTRMEMLTGVPPSSSSSSSSSSSNEHQLSKYQRRLQRRKAENQTSNTGMRKRARKNHVSDDDTISDDMETESVDAKFQLMPAIVCINDQSQFNPRLLDNSNNNRKAIGALILKQENEENEK